MTDTKITEYREYLVNEEKSKATIEKYIRDIQTLMVWRGAREIRKDTVLEYKRYLTENYAPKSVNSIISSLNSFFIFCNRQDLKIKLLKIQRQIFTAKEKELTKYEYEKLLKTAKENGNERLCLVMQTICSMGIRVSEDI